MIYDYKCSHCGHEFEGFNFVDKRHHIECEKCGEKADMVFHPSASRTLFFPFEEYIDEHISRDGEPRLVTSRQHRKDLAAANGLEIR